MIKWPVVMPRQRVGLYGGSFNPAHFGHYSLALQAIKKLQLDWVWWLVSRQNPLKDPNITQDYQTRFCQTKMIAQHPNFVVSDVERQIGAHNSFELLKALSPVLKNCRCVWLMGADSFAHFDHWHKWTHIAESVPLAIFDRPHFSYSALNSQAATRYIHRRVPEYRAAELCDYVAPSWCFLTMPLRFESSTIIRQ